MKYPYKPLRHVPCIIHLLWLGTPNKLTNSSAKPHHLQSSMKAGTLTLFVHSAN